ncbi:MAG: FMN-binding negative transcriptional regulator [Usitatibacter sp.]
MTLYVPPHFRPANPQDLHALMERNAFATLVTAGPRGLHVSHVPFLLDRGSDGKLRLLAHLARANEHWEALEDATHLVAIFQGPHGYISPGWYQNHPSVPTWNYAVVHAHGRARLMDEAQLHELVITLSNTYEAGRAKPWRAGDLPADYVSSMLKAIVGFEIEVERLEGKFKISQNRPAEIPRVIEALVQDGEPELAAFMRAHPPPAKG